LRRLGGRTDGQRVLEIGCGRGVGTEIVLSLFGAAHVDAFDLDPEMVELAEARLARFGDRARVWQGDATAIDAPDAHYDAVFDFGIVHHVPDWRAALREVARVLRPGGRFFFEEVTRHALDRALYRRLFVHPSEDRFTAESFVAALEQPDGPSGAGLPVDRWIQRFFGDFVIGVATRRT